MKTNIFLLPLALLLIIACSDRNENLELENSKLKLKIYEDSIQRLKNEAIKIEEKQKLIEQEKKQIEKPEHAIKQKEETDKNARLVWLCNYASNKEAPARFIMNIPETRFMKINKDGTYSIKSYDGYHKEKLTSTITGNLKDLNPNSVRTHYSDEGYLFIHINCINSICINENGRNIHSTVSFGPYWADHIADFPDKLKTAFEEVISDINGYSEYY
jgi:hypothetical protein